MSTTNTSTKTNCQTYDGTHAGAIFPWDSINESGAYICNWSGHLMRVPEDGVAPGRSPMISMVGPDPLFVTKISDSPYVTVTKAKLLAADLDLNVNF